MQALQVQINTLSDKIDALHAAVERISATLSEPIDQPKVFSERRSDMFQSGDGNRGHKDILDDMPYLESHRNEQVLSPELQIQRLTAQLTAAYNRIAALEEQLLAKHVH
jgi:hypothetical protein